MKRRDFLKGSAGSAAAVGLAGTGTNAEARPNLEPPENAVAMLFDSTLCVGCKACVSACKEVNGLPPETADEALPIWDSAIGLSAQTYNVIQAYTHGDMSEKDRAEDGFAFVKRNCMHCVDPGCVSVCPTTAMYKDPDNGIVFNDPDACIGCRYCVYACPYDVPKFDFDSAYGRIHKCQFCNQPGVERLDQGKLPGCVESCPTGATLFGTREALLEEAHRRLEQTPGSRYAFARETLDAGLEIPARVPTYYQKVFGEKEGGGTQLLHIAGVPFSKLGLPEYLPERSYASRSEGLIGTIYKGMIAPLALLGGLAWLARRNLRAHEEQDGSKEPGQD